MRLFRLNVEVDGIDRARDFYSTLLDLETRPQGVGRFYLKAGDITLQFVEVAVPHLAAKALYFAVSDPEAIHGRARDLGCLSAEPVHGSPGGDLLVRPWGERSFYAVDPAGNPLCFVDERTVFA